MLEGIEFVDADCMVGPWPMRNLAYSSSEELIKQMDRYGIDRALVFHSLSWTYHPEEGNIALNRIFSEGVIDKQRLFPLYCFVAYEALENKALDKYQVQAVRIFPSINNFPLTSWASGEFLKVLVEREISLWVDIFHTEWAHLQKILITYPELKVVLLGAHYKDNRKIYQLLKKYQNLYICTSYFEAFDALRYLCDHVGAERLLFGSRMPFYDAGAPIWNVLRSPLKRREKQLIAAGNLYRLLGKKEISDD